MAYWQLEEAKQRFSEVVERAQADGPQVITRDGEEVAVVISIDEYEEFKKPKKTFKEHLRSGPPTDDLDLNRTEDYGREVRFE
jgi:prevent-host-death family protein